MKVCSRWAAAWVGTVVLTASACGGAPSDSQAAELGEGDDIVIGGSFPLTGPLASYGALAEGFEAYIASVNAEGGIDGHDLVLKKMDDAYDNARAISNIRSLVQREEVFAVLTFGGAPVAVRDYLEQSKVPQFGFAGLSTLSDVDEYEYTRSFWPNIEVESAAAGKFMSDELGVTEISTLTINNDAGFDYVKGLENQAEASGYTLTGQQTYEPTDTQVTSQVDRIRSGDGGALATLVTGATEISMFKYRQQVRYAAPTFIYSGASSIDSFLKPAGADAEGVYAPLWMKDPADPQWADDSALAQYRDIVTKYGNGADPSDIIVANGYGMAEALVAALREADELTPDALLEAWDSLPPTELDVLLPGVELEGNPETGRPIDAYQISQFDGSSWVPVGDVIDQSDIAED